jgi:uncharacterized protein (TIGR02600 family)
MVLGAITLVAVLCILLLSAGSDQRTTAKVTSHGAQARLLADTAVQAAMGQIRLATRGLSSAGEKRFWASQPGAIRTWRPDGQTDLLYKLYSSSESTLAIPDAASRLAAAQRESYRLAQWRADGSTADRFTDLNQPLVKRSLQGAISDIRYPIADPRALALDGVEGFSTAGAVPDGTQLTGDNTARLPMPVEWIYVLKDGSMGTLDAQGTFVGPVPPSRDNPITGRIAFWADDESCKVNINTASEGSPWDLPRCVTQRDVLYARQPPQINEVQRWPGHPATVCLSSIFFPGQNLSDESALSKKQALYDWVPRVHYDSAEGPITFDPSPLHHSVSLSHLRRDGSLQPLFTLPGMDPGRLERAEFFLTAHSRAPELNLHGQPRVSLWSLNENHTAASRRVTAFDRLMHFTTTLNGQDGQEFHVQRQRPESQVDEYHLTPPLLRNSQLAGYLARMMELPTPKYGLSFAEKYPLPDLRFNAYRFIDTIRSANLHDLTRLTPERRVTPYQDAQIPGIVSGLAFSELVGKAGVPPWVKDLENYRLPGRDYTLSEVALVFICIAHHRSDGQQVGDATFFSPTSDSRLAPGEMAVQPALLFELFCPGQGYVMILPHLRLEMASESLLQMRVNGQPSLHAGHSHPHHSLYELWGHPPFTYGNSKPKGPSRGDGTRRPDNWVGWGGSGGFHILTSPIPVKDKVERTRPSNERTGYYLTEYFKVRDDQPLLITSQASTSHITLDLTLQRTWVTSWDARQHLRVELPLPIRCPVPQIDPDQPDLWTWEKRMTLRAQKVLTEPYSAAQPYDKLLLPGDTVRSMVVPHGDYRLPDVWGRKEGRFNQPETHPAENYFTPHPDWQDATRQQAHSLVANGGDSAYYPGASFHSHGFTADQSYPPSIQPDLPPLSASDSPTGYHPPAAFLSAYGAIHLNASHTRDWSTGTGIAPDGAYLARPDDGAHLHGDVTRPPYQRESLPPYYNRRWEDLSKLADTSYSGQPPNRLISSAGIFGSLPSLPISHVPWTTYLFRPDLSRGHLGSKWNTFDKKLYPPAAAATPAAGQPMAPPDHLLMDLFWMPVVLPYGISERFSTAGKINLNHHLLPFSYLRRTTALHAALKAQEILAIPSEAASDYKNPALVPSAEDKWRHPVDATRTLQQLDPVFAAGDAFVSPTELCEHFLIPRGQATAATTPQELAAQMQQFWDKHALTGDNVLEQPYTNLMSLLTTKSNVFRVHFTAEVIQKAPSLPPDRVDTSKDQVQATYRGSCLVERWLPPQPEQPYRDPVTDLEAPPLDKSYHYRVLQHKRLTW